VHGHGRVHEYPRLLPFRQPALHRLLARECPHHFDDHALLVPRRAQRHVHLGATSASPNEDDDQREEDQYDDADPDPMECLRGRLVDPTDSVQQLVGVVHRRRLRRPGPGNAAGHVPRLAPVFKRPTAGCSSCYTQVRVGWSSDCFEPTFLPHRLLGRGAPSVPRNICSVDICRSNAIPVQNG